MTDSQLDDPSTIEHFLTEVSEAFSRAPDGRGLIAKDPVTKRVLTMVDSVAPTPATVLLSGESGVGKEVFARYIHQRSKRSEGPFVAINCAAVPSSLLESELFGHERGAFSGAVRTHHGVFERADGGTLLLDEISEMPIELQAKLLRVLQERQVMRVGGSKPFSVDFRLIATTNRDLASYVEEGHFRRDLYFRLNVIPLKIPSLRERPLDIHALTVHYVEKLVGVFQKNITGFTDEALKKLMSYSYPGNVRELVNILQRAIILCPPDQTFGAEHVVFENTAEVALGVQHLTKSAWESPIQVEDGRLVLAVGQSTLTEIRRTLIIETLRHVDGNRTEAAKILGVSTRTIRNKLKEYREMGVDIPEF